jgi:hypothetical protein
MAESSGLLCLLQTESERLLELCGAAFVFCWDHVSKTTTPASGSHASALSRLPSDIVSLILSSLLDAPLFRAEIATVRVLLSHTWAMTVRSHLGEDAFQTVLRAPGAAPTWVRRKTLRRSLTRVVPELGRRGVVLEELDRAFRGLPGEYCALMMFLGREADVGSRRRRVGRGSQTTYLPGAGGCWFTLDEAIQVTATVDASSIEVPPSLAERVEQSGAKFQIAPSLFLDLDPGPRGGFGQVLGLTRDNTWVFLATGVCDFLSRLLRVVRSFDILIMDAGLSSPLTGELISLEDLASLELWRRKI